MNKIRIKNTELDVSKISFGTSSIHHILSKKDRINLLSNSFDIGISHYDTARYYGHGLAEKTLGECFKHNRGEITISTKIGIHENSIYEVFPATMYFNKIFQKLIRKNEIPNKDFSLNKIQKSFEKSLRNLKTDYVDILYLHEPYLNEITNLEEIVFWLEKLEQSGKIRYFGLSGYVDECLKIENYIPKKFQILQIEDSLENKEISKLLDNNKVPQFTFGYFRKNKILEPVEVIKNALTQNNSGSILFSTRNQKNLKMFEQFL